MIVMPFHSLGIWARGLIALAVPSVGVHLLRRWYSPLSVGVGAGAILSSGEVAAIGGRVPRLPLGPRRRPEYLLAGLALVAVALGGGAIAYPLLRRRGRDDPRVEEGTDSARGREHRIRRPDGADLRAVCYGPEDAPAIVLTHGWGADSAEWHYVKKHLGDRYRLILWDLPGMGRSVRPDEGDWSLEGLARDLEAVLGLAGDRPAVLIGHSIGGMIVLTFCRLFPEALGTRVSGLVLAHTTPGNPVGTASASVLYNAIQKPVLEPLCHLMIALAPLVWLMNCMTYLNGTLHVAIDHGGFSGRETREQLDFTARFLPKAWPAALGRGMLAMFRYDERKTLGRIKVPTLIVAGDQDATTRAGASLEMARSIPGARLVMLRQAKHMGHMEHHARFAEEVDRFVAGCAVEYSQGGS
jgi:pimeloyl-ACP methyl ester carboxylesterase